MGTIVIHLVTPYLLLQIQEDGIRNSDEPGMGKKQKDSFHDVGVPAVGLPAISANHSDAAPTLEKEVLLFA